MVRITLLAASLSNPEMLSCKSKWIFHSQLPSMKKHGQSPEEIKAQSILWTEIIGVAFWANLSELWSIWSSSEQKEILMFGSDQMKKWTLPIQRNGSGMYWWHSLYLTQNSMQAIQPGFQDEALSGQNCTWAHSKNWKDRRNIVLDDIIRCKRKVSNCECGRISMKIGHRVPSFPQPQRSPSINENWIVPQH